jgi:ABC-type spermidine/putrescine transport system permease subunit II
VGLGALVIAFLFLPLVFVVATRFNDNRSMFVWSHFSTKGTAACGTTSR